MDRYQFTQALLRRNVITEGSVEFIDSFDTAEDLDNDCHKFLDLVVQSFDHERLEVDEAVFKQEGREFDRPKLRRDLAQLNLIYLHAHKSVLDSPFRAQLRDFNHKTAGRGKDDFIDAVAMAILSQPVRIKTGHYGSRASEWASQTGGGSIECAVDEVTF